MNARLAHVRHVALDMDGTIYRGSTLFAETLPFLALLKQLGIGYTFLTNNSSKSFRDYLARLKQIGIGAAPEELYTSTQATVAYLHSALPDVRRLFLLGTPSLAAEFAEAGFGLARDDPADEPDAVVIGFDTTLEFNRLCRAAWWIKLGKPFIATHPDRVCPTDEPTLLVDCGSICAALEKATGRQPNAVPGKPDPSMLQGILGRYNLGPYELAMVGDRLYTDMVMARQTGALAVLVLTGEASAEEAAHARPAPDLIVQDLAELGQRLAASRAGSSSRVVSKT